MKKAKRQSFKIALVGATCVGKTSIINILKEKYKNNPKIEFVDEGARAFFAANPEIKDRGAWEVQAGIRDLVLSNEKAAYQRSADFIICDRSIIDSAVYMEAHGDIKAADRLFKSVLKWTNTYNLILILDPKDVPYSADEIRVEGVEFRNHVHQTFISFFQRKKIEYKFLSGTLRERILYIENLLQTAQAS